MNTRVDGPAPATAPTAASERLGAARYPHGMRRAGVFFAGVWLVILAEPVGAMFDRGLAPWQEWLGSAIVLAFCAIYLLTVRTPFVGGAGRAPARYVPYVLLALALAWLPFTGVTGLSAFAFVT